MGAAASALRHRGRLQLDAGSVKAPFSRQKSRKIATVTKAPAKKSPAARNVVTHLLIPYRRRRCAAGRNPTPHGRTCGAAPTLRAGPNQPPARALPTSRWTARAWAPTPSPSQSSRAPAPCPRLARAPSNPRGAQPRARPFPSLTVKVLHSKCRCVGSSLDGVM